MFLLNKKEQKKASKAVAIIVAAGRGERLAKGDDGCLAKGNGWRFPEDNDGRSFARNNEERPFEDNDSRSTVEGDGRGKALVEVAGVPMIVHALCAFEAASSISEIVVVVREVDILNVYDVVRKHGISKVANIVAGGSRRQDSVMCGLRAVSDSDVVAIHDGARPCIRPQKVDEIVRYVMGTGHSAALGVRVTDTLKRVRNSEIIEDVGREDLWQMQTPQVFLQERILKAHEKALHDGFDVTDDAQLAQNYGERVRVIEGDSENVKITTIADLYMVENILRSRNAE